ncbi:MAG: DUF402 domain-containing protein [Chloroflexi bacterium]|nr:DUF402 domain-containing protein [Chloroflexota bacterium]
MSQLQPITVIKRDHRGQYQWDYSGHVIARGPRWVCLQARFNRADYDAGYVVFQRDDLFTEWFYSDRWYNIFKLQAVADGRLKGWYCNITRPATITADQVSADDLALDVFVRPSGEILLLDEDEFAALDLPDAERQAAWAAVGALRAAVAARTPPFDLIG